MTDPDVELLADLDAGLLAPARADEVRRAALADPRCAAVLDALAATRADLAALPVPPAPAVLGRWTAPVDDPGADPGPPDTAPPDSPSTATGPSTVAGHPRRAAGPSRIPTGAVDGRRARLRPGPARSGAGRRARWVLAAAAAAAVALVPGLPATRSDGVLDVDRVELAAAARSTVGLTDLGALADPARRDGCLSAVGVDGARVLGGRQVRLEGAPGVLLVLSTGELGRFRVLVVSPSCSVLDDTVVGGP
ncbi:hypothetical protein GCM10017691_60290 [Pseudonocardia petroleophila]|uniref:Anti-sigma-M factor RsmA n=1 Tax=Pseudonocardia petroleophila TaxID=37331 RepID=A0A7G7MMG8_9PSEU|nr:hypothetical protein [Pseudonocardia petroleophila]QNG53979.1 hypothetical protein H6H00_08735 [Pseudonocardia petroleophila]